MLEKKIASMLFEPLAEAAGGGRLENGDRDSLKENALKQEVHLTTRLRQCFRAVQARDDLAVRDEVPLIRRRLFLLLEYLLESEDSWASSDIWFDDMINFHYQLLPPGRFRISGRLAWGLLSDPGPQWSEPCFADVVICEGRSDTASYCIRFGRRDDRGESDPVQFGFYPGPEASSESVSDPWKGKADWKYEFRKDGSSNFGTPPG